MSPAAAARTDLVRACFREPVTRTPVWFMRQAGRSLPEYRAARGGGSILAAIADAPLAAELTLQPVRRYGVDAAILFSDIVVPLQAIGFGVDVEPGRGPVVADPSAAATTWAASGRSSPTLDAPYVAETVRLVRRELDGSGVALIGFAGAPFTVASYLVEGGPSRTFAKVKALMHGDPALWGQLTDRLVAMAVASLRAQIEAGAQAVQLFDSWAGSLAPGEYARFALPATRAVLEGVADLGVPTILFGVGTGELLGLMGSAGSDVVGVDWRVPLDEARRRVGAAARAAGQPRPRAVPGTVAGRRGRHADGARRGRRRDRHRPRLQPRPWRPARVGPGRPGRRGRPGARRDRADMTTGVLLMAHGTPSSAAEILPFYTRIRRGRPPTPAQLAELEGRYRAIGGVSPLAERTAAQVDAVRAGARGQGAGPLRRGVRRQAHRPSHRGRRDDARLGGSRAGHRSRPHAPRIVPGLAGVPRPRRGRARQRRPSCRWPRGTREPGVRRPPCGAGPGSTRHRRRVALASSSPRTPCPSASAPPATPTPSSSPSRPGSSRRRPGSRSGPSPGRARDAPPNPGSGPTCATSCATWRPTGGVDAVVVCPIGFVADHLEVLYDLDVELARRRRGIAASPTHAPRHSTTTPASSLPWPT